MVPPMLRHRRLALTLLEVLATVVLMGLVATALSVAGVLRGQPRAALAAAVGVLRTSEHRARADAIGGGGSWQITNTDVRGGVAWPINRTGVVWSEPLPAQVDIHLLVDGRPTDRVTYDVRGRSADADLTVNGFGGETRLHLAGLTGIWSEVAP